jgi:drug/metabolite transporter (DMT)-like permease
MAFFISSLLYQSSGVSALFIALTPVATMIYAHFLLPDDRMNLRKTAGAAISFAGVGLLLATGETGLAETRWEGFVLVLLGVAANGFGTVHVRRFLANESSLDVTSVRLVAATVILAPLAWALAGWDFSRLEPSGWLALIYGGIPGTLFGFLVYSHAAARYGPSKATQSEFLVPVVAVTGGSVFLDERLTAIVVAGMVLALIGIYVAPPPRQPQPERQAQP